MPPTIIDSSRHQSRFLAAFGACASVLQAARWAKINRQCHYNWLKEDPTYAERFRQATDRAAQSLEDEATRRAHEGIRKAVRYKGKIVGYETEFSDQLLIERLRAVKPEKYRPPQRVEHGGVPTADGTPTAIRVHFVTTGADEAQLAGSVDPEVGAEKD